MAILASRERERERDGIGGEERVEGDQGERNWKFLEGAQRRRIHVSYLSLFFHSVSSFLYVHRSFYINIYVCMYCPLSDVCLPKKL